MKKNHCFELMLPPQVRSHRGPQCDHLTDNYDISAADPKMARGSINKYLINKRIPFNDIEVFF